MEGGREGGAANTNQKPDKKDGSKKRLEYNEQKKEKRERKRIDHSHTVSSLSK